MGASDGYTLEEVAKHDTEKDCWLVIGNSNNGGPKVYDVTKYLPLHPGGVDSIMLNAGEDTTEEFEAIHSKKAWKQLDDYYIGDLAEALSSISYAEPASELPLPNPVAPPAAPAPELPSMAMGKANKWEGAIALNPKKKISLKLIKREEVSHNTRIFTYELPSAMHLLGLPVGKHVLVYGKDRHGKMAMRAYTPISTNADLGVMKMLIKVYFPNKQYPEGGVLSQYLDNMKLGESIDVKGPIGHIMYKGDGEYLHNKTTSHAKSFVMLAGGTGITPMWQLMLSVLSDPEDPTMLYLVFANSTLDDVLMYQEIEDLVAKHPDRLKVWHTLSRPPVEEPVSEGPVKTKKKSLFSLSSTKSSSAPKSMSVNGHLTQDTATATSKWKYGTGRVNEQMLKEHLPAMTEDVTCFLCGPDPFMHDTCIPIIKKMGCKEDRILLF